MRKPVGRLLVAVALLGGVLVVTAGTAVGAAPGPGSFTKITTPGATTYFKFDAAPGATTNHFVVSGTTSLDVTSVDIDCLFSSNTGMLTAQPFATSVPVSDGAFSVVAVPPNLPAQCRLRAIPVGVDTSDYLGSYAGPILYTEVVGPVSDGSVTYGVVAVSEGPGGLAAIAEDSQCIGVFTDSRLESPQMQVEGSASPGCYLGIQPVNIDATGVSTGSGITVSGENAYLPAGVATYLIGSLSLPVQQPAATVALRVTSSHQVIVTESEPLLRCSPANTFPPTSTSCTSLVSTGVTYKRVSTVTGATAHVQFRDAFVSTDHHAHPVAVQYAGERTPPTTGAIGYNPPGHGSTFSTEAHSETVTGFGTRAGSLLIRSDVDAVADEPTAETDAISWSRAPKVLQFTPHAGELGIGFALQVPANGSVDLGLDMSASLTTTSAQGVAARTVASTVSTPKVTKPGKKVHGKVTTVVGAVANGANGAVRSVTVNGHKARLTAGTTSTAFRVSLKESLGAHTLTVVATDVAGNTASRRIKVTNVH